MRHTSEIDDLKIEHGQPDDSWVAGEIELTEERPETALRGDPSQRKWMLIGVSSCALLTAIAVLLLTQDVAPARAAEQPAVEPEPVVQQLEPAAEPTPVQPSPAVKQPKREKPTLATTSHAAAAPAPIKKAPPVPVAPVADQPTTPAAQPSKPSKAEPASEPKLPAEQQPSGDGPAADLPDVEPWDEADAAVEQDDDEPAEPEPSGLADV